MPEITETFFAVSRRSWRAWLARHHAGKRKVWLVLFKKHVDEPCVSYEAAVEEALCFGWIDGILKRIDERQHAIRFTPRRRRSVWSESNKTRVAKLIAARKMTEAGLAQVAAAKADGRWDKGPPPTEPPADLARALARNRRAGAHFAAMSPSHRRAYVGWVLEAKREQTRSRRIREVVRRCAANQKPGM